MSPTDAERLARGALLQQAVQITRLVGGMVVLTLIARELSFNELGIYALLISSISYVQFVKAGVMNAAVIAVAGARDDADALSRTVSTGFVVYAVLGLLSGLALLALGLLALPLLHVPEALRGAARTGIVGVAVVTAVGWPVQIFDDVLRGQQRFGLVSLVEIVGLIASAGGTFVLVLSHSSVWMLVTWTAAGPLLTGVFCAVVALPDEGVSVSPRHVERTETRRFATSSGLLIAGGLADVIIQSLDRVILAAIRSPFAVGRYEGPLQMQNVVKYVHGVLGAPLVPAVARYAADGDTERGRMLFERGARYLLVATTPLVIVLAVQAGPIMTLWLGDRFQPVATVATLAVGVWLLAANMAAVAAVLLGTGQIRRATAGQWAAALTNLTVTLACTPSIGLYGPIAGSYAGYCVQLAAGLPAAVRAAGSSWSGLAREAWLPAYGCAVPVAAGLAALGAATSLDGTLATLGSLVATPLVYWGLFAWLCSRPDERALALRVLRVRHRRA